MDLRPDEFQQLYSTESECRDPSEFCMREFMALMKYLTVKNLDIGSWYEHRLRISGNHTLSPIVDMQIQVQRRGLMNCSFIIDGTQLDLSDGGSEKFDQHCKFGDWEQEYPDYLNLLNNYSRKMIPGINCSKNYLCMLCISHASSLHKKIPAIITVEDNQIQSCRRLSLKLSKHRSRHGEQDENFEFKIILTIILYCVFGIILLIGLLVQDEIKKKRRLRRREKLY